MRRSPVVLWRDADLLVRRGHSSARLESPLRRQGTSEQVPRGARWREMRDSRACMRLATAVVALHLAVALFGFAALFGQWIALPPAIIVLGRTLVAAMTLALAAPLFHRATGRPSMALAVNGALLALHWVSFFAAVQTASVAIGLLSYASFPAFVVAIESVVERRRPRLGGAAVVGVVVLGSALLVPDF